jgi:hypothetical protein
MNNFAFHPSLEDESPLQQAPSELSRLDRLIVPAIVAGRPVANIPPTNDMHPIAIAMPLIALAAMIAAFWLALAGSDRSLISAVAILIVMMLLGVTTACVALAHKVGPNGTHTRTFREFLDGEVDVETGRVSGRVAFRQVATIPVVVAIGSTLMLACAVSTHG